MEFSPLKGRCIRYCRAVAWWSIITSSPTHMAGGDNKKAKATINMRSIFGDVWPVMDSNDTPYATMPVFRIWLIPRCGPGRLFIRLTQVGDILNDNFRAPSVFGASDLVLWPNPFVAGMRLARL